MTSVNSDRTVVDLFCGAGGLSAGLQQAGFRVCVGNDVSCTAGRTFARTHPGARFLPGPIEGVSANDFLKAAGAGTEGIFCLAGGPPCQAFSVYNHQRGLHDARSQLFKEYLRIVAGTQPRWIILENVAGILSAGGGAAVREIMSSLNGLGYQVEYRILRSEDYGVPQERRRVVFLGNRVGLPIVWPKITHGPGGLKRLVTVRDAIFDLPDLVNGEGCSSSSYKSEAVSEYQEIMRRNSAGVFNHAAPKLSEVNLKRMAFIPEGGSWRDIPFDLLPEGMKKAKRSDHTKRYGRMSWSGQSCTVLTKCDLHWGAFIHPEQDRSITVREAARLQSFPDSFVFEGSQTEQFIQVGNAVPPLLGKAIGHAIDAAEAVFDRVAVAAE